jgi:hypothetical protein
VAASRFFGSTRFVVICERSTAPLISAAARHARQLHLSDGIANGNTCATAVDLPRVHD